MATRRKTWMGVGLFAVAGTTASVTALAAAGALTAERAAHVAPAPGAMLLAQTQGGEAGGEGGEIPQSYVLPGFGGSDVALDAAAVIATYAKGVEATYEASFADAQALAAAIDAFLADPSEANLAAARETWVRARVSYLQSEAFRFYDGPIEAVEGEINSWPINEAFIDSVAGKPDSGIINDPTIDVSIAQLIIRNAVSDESDVTLGWHAIEFLLWGQDHDPNGPGARPANDYTPGVGNNDRRREYLKLVTARLASDIGRLVPAWAPGEPDNYAATFQALPAREAIGRILNGIAVLAGSELMSERMAVGLDSGDQEDEQSCFSDTTHQDFVYDVQGIVNVWTGAYPGGVAGPGVRDLVAKVDPELAKAIDGEVQDLVAKIAKLGDPWDQVLASPEGSPARADAEAAVTALGTLAEALKTAGEKLGVLVQIPAG